MIGRVLELNDEDKYLAYTNHGGARGFSGTGLFAEKNIIGGVYTGSD